VFSNGFSAVILKPNLLKPDIYTFVFYLSSHFVMRVVFSHALVFIFFTILMVLNQLYRYFNMNM